MEYSEFQENYEESQDESLVSDESSSAQRGKFEVGIVLKSRRTRFMTI